MLFQILITQKGENPLEKCHLCNQWPADDSTSDTLSGVSGIYSAALCLDHRKSHFGPAAQCGVQELKRSGTD